MFTTLKLNTAKTGLATCAILLGVGLGTSAQAFTNVASETRTLSIGTCGQHSTYRYDGEGSTNYKAYVAIATGYGEENERTAIGTGYYWYEGGLSQDAYPELTAGRLETVCGLFDVTGLEQKGIDNLLTFEQQGETYIRFKARTTVDGPFYSYDFSIDNSGITNSITRSDGTPLFFNVGDMSDRTVVAGKSIRISPPTVTNSVGDVTFSWSATYPDGVTGTLVNDLNAPDDAIFTVNPVAQDEIVTFRVIATDQGTGLQETREVAVTVLPGADTVTPTAIITIDPDDVEVVGGDKVTLFGGQSNDDGDTNGIVTYSWRALPSDGVLVALLDDDTDEASFVAPTGYSSHDIDLTIELIVTDHEGLESEPDFVSITLLADTINGTAYGNDVVQPTAVAEVLNASVGSEEKIQLIGDNSYDEDDTDTDGIVSYKWSLTSATFEQKGGGGFVETELGGVTMEGQDTSKRPIFSAPRMANGDLESDAKLTFALIVTDGEGRQSDPSYVDVTVKAEPYDDVFYDGVLIPWRGPLARAGADQTVVAGDMVTLDGTTSPYSVTAYGWEFVSSSIPAEDVQFLYDSSNPADNELLIPGTKRAQKAHFVAPWVSGLDPIEMVFKYTMVTTGRDDNPNATDGVFIDSDTVTITVVPGTDVVGPYAAVDDIIIEATPGELVELNGLASGDNIGIVSYTWSHKDATSGELSEIANTAVAYISAPMLADGVTEVTETYSLKVANVAGITDEIEVQVNVKAEAEVQAEEPLIDVTQTAIATFMQARAGHVISAQPDLIGLLSGANTGAFNATVTQSNGFFNFATSSEDRRIWSSVQGSWSTSGDAENGYFFGAVGGHFNVTSNAIAGLMLEFDTLTQEYDDTTTSGSGFLVGPYLVAKLQDQPLFFEGRYLIGTTSNTTGIDDYADQAFDTSRSLAKFKVAGQIISDTLTLTPSLSFTHLTEIQGKFYDNYDRLIPEQGIAVSEGELGLDFAKPMAVKNGKMLLTGGIAGIWSASSNSGFASTITPDYEGQRGRLHLGTVYTSANGMTVNGDVSYDGLLAEDYQSVGVNFGLTKEF